MNTGRAPLVLLLTAAPWLPSTAARLQAQTSLTLERALELAREGNPAYRSALNNLDLAVPETRQAWGAFLPSLNLSAGTSGGFTRQLVGTDDFGNPIPNPNAQTRYNSGSNQGLGLSVPLFEGGRRFHELGQARAAGEARRWTARAELLRVEASVERDFYTAQRQQELLAIEQALLDEVRRDLEATERLFALAGKSRSDVLGAELAVRRQDVQVRAAAGERDKALLGLQAAIGVPTQRVEAVDPTAVVLFDPSTVDVEGLVGQAVENHATVRSAAADEQASAAATSAARARRWPSLTLDGSLGRGTFAQDGEALFDLSPNDRSNGNLQLSLSIPVFRQFQTSYQIAQADVGLRNAQETTRLRRLEVERDVRSAWIDLMSASDQVEATRAAQDVAEERLRLVREEYRLAVKSFEELQSAVREDAQARRDALGARYDFVQARIAFEEAAGVRMDDLLSAQSR
ncbi:MAG: TolC family protein [Gemmatimonadota bacterium]